MRQIRTEHLTRQPKTWSPELPSRLTSIGTYWDRILEYLGLKQRTVAHGYRVARYQHACDRCGATVQPDEQPRQDAWHRSHE